jgi:hypothetical protein
MTAAIKKANALAAVIRMIPYQSSFFIPVTSELLSFL